ncbi:RGS domain-containing protein [Paraphysoderma sedebokerense]|nr:RGS domain-containing protein [Paraphysoderma sedebokerense]
MTTEYSYYAMLVILHVYMLGTLGAFLYFRKVDYLTKRQPLVVTLHTLAALVVANDYMCQFRMWSNFGWTVMYGKDILSYIFQYTFAPVWMLFYFLRCVSFVSEYYTNISHVRVEDVHKMNVVERMMFRLIAMLKSHSPEEASASNDRDLTTSKSSIEIVNLGPRTILKAAGVTYIISTIILLTVLGYADCYRNGDLVWLFSVVVICHTISVTAPVLGVDIMKLRPTKESVNNTLDNFNKILMDRRLFAQFKKSLAEDFSIENGLFFEDLLALENDENKRKNSPKLYEKSIIAIYQNYIKPGANHELNIAAPTRKKITQEIQAKNYKLEIYEQAKKEVCQMMYQTSFPRFLAKLKGSSLNGSTTGSIISKPTEVNNFA